MIQLPNEVQVHILSFLRSYDLSPLQKTCRFYNDPDLIHEVVTHFGQHVYGTEFTDGIIEMTMTDSSVQESRNRNNAKGKHLGKKTVRAHHETKNNRKLSSDNHHDSGTATATTTTTASQFRYKLTHLRSIELTVVARVLSLPEPKTGYFVSKSWIKKTLLWLEMVNQQATCTTTTTTTTPKKKITKKQQRQRNRRLSDVSVPWPNANIDILCEHQNLQRSGAKAARSHRKLMDKKSWKVLKKLYPDSTQLDSVTGECLQCRMESETARKDFQDKLEQEKLERKQPLSNPHVRRFYTRTRGVPYHCLVENTDTNTKTGDSSDLIAGNKATDEGSNRGGGKISALERSHASAPSHKGYSCPLTCGTYVILPRSWCHQWRRYIKTGEDCMPLPPESSVLLCDAHKLPLLPPHLDAFLRGETPQLFASVKEHRSHEVFGSFGPSPVLASVAAASVVIPRSPVGVRPVLDAETIHALTAAGISRTEAAAQVTAMQQLEAEQRRPRFERLSIGGGGEHERFESSASSSSSCNKELLDRENHLVVELVTHEEWLALQEAGSWRKHASTYSMCVTVDKDGSFAFSTLPCRECDPTGLRFSSSCASMKNMFRSKRWEPKNVEHKRIPNLEY